MTARLGGTVLLAAILGGVACGGGAGSDENPPPPMQSAVAVSNNTFTPRVDSVAKGGTVTWTWTAGSNDHNVISTGAPTFTSKGTAVVPPNGTDGVDYFDEGTTHQVTYPNAGTYKYYCSTHGTSQSPDNGVGMGGRIVVVP